MRQNTDSGTRASPVGVCYFCLLRDYKGKSGSDDKNFVSVRGRAQVIWRELVEFVDKNRYSIRYNDPVVINLPGHDRDYDSDIGFGANEPEGPFKVRVTFK